jgi:hypothetical protein
VSPGIQVASVSDGSTQVFADEPDGFQSQGHRDRLRTFRDVGFDGVGQGVHPRRRGHGRRGGDGEEGVHDGRPGQNVGAYDPLLHVAPIGLHVRKNAVGRHLTAGSRRGRQQDHRERRFSDIADTPHLIQRGLVGQDRRGRLGDVQRAAAAETDDAVGGEPTRELRAAPGGADRGVGLDVVENLHGNPVCLEARNGMGDAVGLLAEDLVGDDNRARDSQRLRLGAYGAGGSITGDDLRRTLELLHLTPPRASLHRSGHRDHRLGRSGLAPQNRTGHLTAEATQNVTPAKGVVVAQHDPTRDVRLRLCDILTTGLARQIGLL